MAVFTCAQVPMDLLKVGFDALCTFPWNRLGEGLGSQQLCARRGSSPEARSVIVFLPSNPILCSVHPAALRFGYMARAALSDGPDHGRRLVARPRLYPAVVEFSPCAIPASWATRVIDTPPRTRLDDQFVAPLMTCSARIPVYTLIILCLRAERDGVGSA